MKEFERLYEIIRVLRSDVGCPWDREQTIPSMAENLLEEAYEVIDGIDNLNMDDLKEELGDLMFLTVFISYLAEQEGAFTVPEVVEAVADKLVRRHPHVFGNQSVNGVDDVLVNWEAIKKTEKKNENRKTPFDGIPKSLPELIRFNKVLRKIERENVPLTEMETYDAGSLEQSFQAMNGDFSESNVQAFLSKLLMRSYVESVDVAALIRSSIHDMQARFLKKYGSNSKD